MDAGTLSSLFDKVRTRTAHLAEPLTAEDCVVQSMPDVSPTKWHLAHTTWFFEEFVLSRAKAPYDPFDPRFGYLFNSYYDAVGPRHARPSRGLLSRPALSEVMEYRAYVDRAMHRLLETDAVLDLAAVIELGLAHEEQHQELILTDIKHVLSENPLAPAYVTRKGKNEADRDPPALSFVDFEGGLASIGHGGDGFAYDNEMPRHRVVVQPYSLANRLITNGEYLAFIADGGYERPELWLSDGFAAVQKEGLRAPLYFRSEEGSLFEFTLSGRRSLARDTPVSHVSFYEAEAFARWAGARLPTEAEWELCAVSAPVEGNFVESDGYHPEKAQPRKGVAQLYGDLWEWTQSPYVAYPGYRPLSGALGEYNGKFMCNQLVLRGGSCATPLSHIRATYRNFFPPNARWQFTGIRLAKDA